jgi:hypothetical protein
MKSSVMLSAITVFVVVSVSVGLAQGERSKSQPSHHTVLDLGYQTSR